MTATPATPQRVPCTSEDTGHPGLRCSLLAHPDTVRHYALGYTWIDTHAEATTGPATVDGEVWEADPDRPGYLKLIRTKSAAEVFAEIIAITGKDPEGGEEYFALDATKTGPWPARARIVCYAVTGANEGHYVHVGAIHDGGRYESLLIAKTFSGADAAWGLARRLATILRT